MIDWFFDNAGIIGLLFFFSIFSVVLLWIFRPGSKPLHQQHAQIPLREQNGEQA